MKSAYATGSRPERETSIPRSFEELRVHVSARQEGLPKRLAQAARFALSHPDEIALGTAASIADAAGVQPSTLVRLAHHLGDEGFSDVQSVFRDRLQPRASTYEERLRKIESGAGGESYDSALLNGFVSAGRQSLDRLSETISSAEFGRCVGVLAKADTIYLIARRRSYPLIAQMSYAFAKLKIRAMTVDSSNGIDTELVELATPADAAIACSFAPYAPS
ncbi:MAG: MurR/RpiR family transcriptional regulator, partial [Pararhizobium sp.]